MQTETISSSPVNTQVKSIPIKFERFQATDDADCQRRILAAREKLGKNLVILGHHYQNEGVYRHACLLYTSPSPRDLSTSRMPSSA